MFFEQELEEEMPKGAPVPLRPYIAPPMKNYRIMGFAELQTHAGKVMLYDVECYPNYWCVSFKLYGTNDVYICELGLGKKFSATALSWIMHNFICVGFNNNHYDTPMVWLAYRRPDTTYLYEMSKTIIEQNLRRFEIEELGKFRCHPTNTVDIFDVPKLKGSLKTFAARLHAKRLQDLPYSPHTELTLVQAAVVLDYNINDLDNTELLLRGLEDEIKLRKELGLHYKIDLRSKSDAQIAEYVIAAEFERMTGAKPKKPDDLSGTIYRYKVPHWLRFETPFMQEVLRTVASADYIVSYSGKVLIPDAVKNLRIVIGNSTYRMGNGGLHSSESEVSYKVDDETRIVDRDVASYYPAIILTQKLVPESLGSDFLAVYDDIVQRRLKAKKTKDHVTAQALKITINGGFGKFGSPFSILYAPDLLIQVTVSGQLCLLFLIEKLEQAGIECISANTDGVVMKLKSTQHIPAIDPVYERTIHDWEKTTGFITEETEYTSVHSRDVNAYMAFGRDEDGKPTYKGKNVFFNPWDGKAKNKIFRLEKNPWAVICVEACQALIEKGTPVEETIKGCTDLTKFVCVRGVAGGAHKDNYYLGKVVRWYYAKGIHGIINYVIGNKKVSQSDGAKPCMILPDKFPDDIDYDRYVSMTVEHLEKVGFYHRLKDVSFF